MPPPKLPYRHLEPILPKVAELNKAAIETALAFDVHSCTDITGFGLMGHTLEMAKGSKVRIELAFDRLPVHPYVFEMYQKGETTGSNKSNRRMAEGHWERKRQLSRDEEELLFDPQTSGGLLLSVPSEQAGDLFQRLKQNGVQDAVVIGEVLAGKDPSIVIL